MKKTAFMQRINGQLKDGLRLAHDVGALLTEMSRG